MSKIDGTMFCPYEKRQLDPKLTSIKIFETFRIDRKESEYQFSNIFVDTKEIPFGFGCLFWCLVQIFIWNAGSLTLSMNHRHSKSYSVGTIVLFGALNSESEMSHTENKNVQSLSTCEDRIRSHPLFGSFFCLRSGQRLGTIFIFYVCTKWSVCLCIRQKRLSLWKDLFTSVVIIMSILTI